MGSKNARTLSAKEYQKYKRAVLDELEARGWAGFADPDNFPEPKDARQLSDAEYRLHKKQMLRAIKSQSVRRNEDE